MHTHWRTFVSDHHLLMAVSGSDRDRLEALYATGLLDSPPEEEFDRLTDFTCRLLRAPVALITLVDENRQFFKSSRGLPEPWHTRRETPLSHSFCRHVAHRGAPLVVPDARTHPLVCDNLAIRDLGLGETEPVSRDL